jgi:hypothetical protein
MHFFEHREVALSLAGESFTSVTESLAVVTWVEVLLCKMADCISILATANCPRGACLHWLKAQQDEDNLQASLQLPRKLL